MQVTDLHRHMIDHLTIPSRQGKGVLKRVDEVFDCWFESGSMPYAQLHYPFENKEFFEGNFPADFVAEGKLHSFTPMPVNFLLENCLPDTETSQHLQVPDGQLEFVSFIPGSEIGSICLCRAGSDKGLVLHADGAVHCALQQAGIQEPGLQWACPGRRWQEDEQAPEELPCKSP